MILERKMTKMKFIFFFFLFILIFILLLFVYNSCGKGFDSSYEFSSHIDLKHPPDIKNKPKFSGSKPTVDSNSVDILFVINDTGHMEEESIQERFPGFIESISSFDWRIAFTTTSDPIEYQGRTESTHRKYCRPGPYCSRAPNGLFAAIQNMEGIENPAAENSTYFLSSDANQDKLDSVESQQKALENTIKSIHSAYGNFAPDSKILHAIYNSVRRHQICKETPSSTGCSKNLEDKPNKDFFRSNTLLVLILISNTNEGPNSYNGYIQSPEALMNYIKSVLGLEKKIFIYSILKKKLNAWISGECGPVKSEWSSNFYLSLSYLFNGFMIDMDIESYTECLSNKLKNVL